MFYIISFLLDIFPGVSPILIAAAILALVQLVIYLIYILLTKGRKTNIYVPIIWAISLGGHGLIYITVNTIIFLLNLVDIRTNEGITLPLYASALTLSIIFALVGIRIFDKLTSKEEKTWVF